MQAMVAAVIAVGCTTVYMPIDIMTKVDVGACNTAGLTFNYCSYTVNMLDHNVSVVRGLCCMNAHTLMALAQQKGIQSVDQYHRYRVKELCMYTWQAQVLPLTYHSQ